MYLHMYMVHASYRAFIFSDVARPGPARACTLPPPLISFKSPNGSNPENNRSVNNYRSVTNINVTVFWKTDHLHTKTEIHLLPVRDRHTHALSRNTKYQTIDCQVCFYRRLFADAVKPQGCISWSWGALIGLHGAPNCSSRQSGPPWWIVSVHATY